MIRRLGALWPKHATRVVLAVAVAGLFAVSAAHAAPTSTLYMIDYYDTNPSTLVTVQGGTGAITTTSMQSSDTTLAVTSTVKTLSQSGADQSPVTGYQYTLNGTFTGTTYPAPAGVQGTFLTDGASDGTNNYSVDSSSTTVFKFNGNWGNPQVLFTTPIGAYDDFRGIAYNNKDNTL